MAFGLTRYLPTETDIGFISLRWPAFIASWVLIALSALFVYWNGVNLGIDFKGGSAIQIETPAAATDEDFNTIRSTLATLGYGDVKVQGFGAPDQVLIKVERSSDAGADEAARISEEVMTALGPVLPGVKLVNSDEISGVVSGELTTKALIAISVAIGLMVCYILIRFDWQFSLGALIALMHDIILAMGIYTALGFEVNLATVAAGLTIIGYSMNDTVVVFDRIRENLRKYKQTPLAEVINKSVNETLPRTIMTSVTTLIALIALFMLGGAALSGFTFAMILGVVVGTYSSIFIASPILLFTGVERDQPGEIDDRP